ncbi:GNAT family N-acetyltransferase [Cohnella suwonensis]|uniref:GNAT family N-acetyltransferase n=1 Tax=Cohnella suwonensis TaxID=696072 RepID=A0ABW0LZ35_9BACL
MHQDDAGKPLLALEPMTEEDGEAICEWRYPSPYERFKWPEWERMKKNGLEFADADIRSRQYLAVRETEGGELVGYAQLFPMEGVVRLGMGLRPDRCDRGWGTLLTRMLVREALRRQPGAEVDLEVEQWNKRAIRVYEKTGFKRTDQYSRRAAHGTVNLYVMVWQGRR